MVFSTLIDLIFPPLCIECNSYTREKFFCSTCWKQCAPLNPIKRCRSCFKTLEKKEDLCISCRIYPDIKAMRGIVFDPHSPACRLPKTKMEGFAAFAYYQYLQLGWEKPDYLFSMQDQDSIKLTKHFRAFLSLEKKALIEEDKTILLIDFLSRKENLKKVVESLQESFPKKIYCLSLFSYDYLDF